jgi:hypothetical protein
MSGDDDDDEGTIEQMLDMRDDSVEAISQVSGPIFESGGGGGRET